MLLTLEKKKVFSTYLLKLCMKYSYFVVVNYFNLSVEKIDALRKLCRSLDVEVRVMKNTVAKKALQETVYDDICKYLTKPTLFFFTNSDVAILVKKINDLYVKNTGSIQFKCFYLDGNVYGEKFVNRVMFLPNLKFALCKFFFVLKILLLNLICFLRELCVKFIKLLICVKFTYNNVGK